MPSYALQFEMSNGVKSVTDLISKLNFNFWPSANKKSLIKFFNSTGFSTT